MKTTWVISLASNAMETIEFEKLSETVAVRKRMNMVSDDYDGQTIPGDKCFPNFLTFVIHWEKKNSAKKNSTSKLIQPWIEPGPAAWEAMTLPLDWPQRVSNVMWNKLWEFCLIHDIIFIVYVFGVWTRGLSKKFEILANECLKNLQNLWTRFY